jgi:PA14 domain-containing protein
VTATTTLKAKAFRAGLAASATMTAGFTSDTDYSPSRVSGLQLWWRADAGVPTGFGDLWLDQSGTGNHGSVTYGPSVPRLVPNGLAALPYMHFDGGDAVYFARRLTNIRTVFWVLREDPSAGYAYRVMLGDGYSSSDFSGEYGSPGPIWRSCCTNGFILNGQTRLNGQLIDGTATPRPRTWSVLSLVTTGDVTASNFGWSNGYSPWHGDLAELAIYDRALGADERKQVEDYLRIQYWDVSATPGDHQVSLAWTTRPSAVRYDVERTTTSGSGYAVVAPGLTGTTFTNTGLDAETTYYYRVVAIDASANRFPSREVVGTPLRIGSGTGLSCQYFNTADLSGPVVLARTDPTVNFDWQGGSPDGLINVDNFSARWTGQVLAPVTGDFTFATNSDDGLRLWVDGRLVVENWTDHGDTLNTSAPVHLEAGQRYDLRLDWYEHGGGALIRLEWSYPGQGIQAIPQSQLYPVTP